MTNKVVVLGSTNVDQFLTVERYAKPGETLHVEEAQKAYGGGKGANRAIATARLGAETTFISKVGTEGIADFMFKDFEAAGIDTSYVVETEQAQTGQAFITVDAQGQNTIYVYGGANMTIDEADVARAEQTIAEADFIVAQLEVPIPAITAAFKMARAHGVTTLLNPAPAKALPDDLLQLIDIIVPNESEAETLSGVPVTDEASMRESAAYFHDLGIHTVLITLGEHGTFYSTDAGSEQLSAYPVKAVDTTAAGDTFIGALVSHLASDMSNLTDAIDYANKAGSLTVQRAGAQAAIPHANDIE